MTHSELRDKMRSLANVDVNRLPDANATDFLNDAKDEVMTLYRLRFGEAYITTAFAEDGQTINPAPTSGLILYPTRMWYASDNPVGDRSEVREISWNEYIEKYGTAQFDATDGSGDPAHFAVYGEDDSGNPTFWLGPIPDAARTVYLTARITFPDLDEDDDENQLTNRAGLALCYKALCLAASFLEDMDRLPEWQAAFDRIIKRIALGHDGARYSAKYLGQMQEPG